MTTISYTPLSEFASKHRVSYLELCAAVREAVAPAPSSSQEAQHPDAPSRPALPPLNDAMIEILGRICFRCIRIAHILRKGGQAIPNRAENEQAAAIYFMLQHYLQHGDGWHEHAEQALQAMVVTEESVQP